MATTAHQPLLNSLTPKHSQCKTICVIFISLAAVLAASTAFLALNFIPRHTLCEHALDQPSCLSLLSQLGVTHTNGPDLLQNVLDASTSHIKEAIKMATQVNKRVNMDARNQAALSDCVELMWLSSERVAGAKSALANQTTTALADAHTWLSSVLTNHVTCLDELTGPTRILMDPPIKHLISLAKTSLAVLVSFLPRTAPDPIEALNSEFPSWVAASDRRLLQSVPNAITANLVVAKDGSGNYKTVKEAVAAAPINSKSRYNIYVKKGTYKETVEIASNKKNIFLYGDGMDNTVITGSLNFIDGTSTMKTATVAALGDGFMAQDIWFQNTAGAAKHQAVALRVAADQSIINKCRIDAYQDTLYTHNNRQFYRDCTITGTVDFIFGNAAVVFQNCKLVVRKPGASQKNMVTAQGRTDPNQNTGTSIQNCEITASSDLEPVKGSYKSYLGRPWKEYSRTVVMQTYIGDLIDPTGWAEWDKDFALKTLYYGEYSNRGPGAGTSKRVAWGGYKVITTAAEAKKFTVAELIQGAAWLKTSGVAYTEGL